MATIEFNKEEMEWRKVGDEHILIKALNELNNLDSKGPYDAKDLGKLKSLDEAVQATDDYAPKKLEAQLLLQDRALASLPKPTAAALKTSKGSSRLALELLRRDLTEFNALAKALYASTEEQRRADDGLRRLHIAFNPVVELHGALATSGIDVGEREWATRLTENLPNLQRLRSTPWHEVALLLKLISLRLDIGGEAPADNGGQHNSGSGSDSDSEGLQEFDGSRLWKNPPTRAETRIIEELYAIGEGAPAIRQQVLSVRLGLDVADELEEMGIYDASTMTVEDTRLLIGRATTQLEEEEAAEAEATKAAEEAENADRSRALPALAAIATKILPIAAKAAPKLTSVSKLTKLGGKGGIGNMGNKLNALSSNGGGGGGVQGALDQGAGVIASGNQALSGLVTGIKQVKEIKELLAYDGEADVAKIEQEKARLAATMDSVREELERVSVKGESDEGIKRALSAVEKAKAAVAPAEGWRNRIAPDTTETLQSSLQSQRLTLGDGNYGTGYSSNEELVAKASGGAALYGINFFPTTTDIVLKPYTPILAPPTYVQMTGAVANFEASVWQTTSVSKATAFHNISDTAGNSMAIRIATSEGGSASGGGWFASASGSSSSESNFESKKETVEERTRKYLEERETRSATVIEYIKCPMKSFRIPMTRMQLSEDALKTALEVDSFRDAEEFLDSFGSHVSNGRQELGGIFYSTMTISSEKKAKSAAMMMAASEQSSTLREKSKTTEGGGQAGFLGIGGKASASFGRSTSVGTTTVNTKAQGSGDAKESLNARYQQYVRCTGPRAPTPETFAEALFNDNSSWAVTDRGPIEALVPVTRVLQNTIELMSDGPDKRSLQTSVNYITAAWRIRAKLWDATDPDDASKADMPPAILKLIRSASPEEQGRVHDLIWAVYGVLEFVPGVDDENVHVGEDFENTGGVVPKGKIDVRDSKTFKVWSDHDEPEPSSEVAGTEAADAIRQAAKTATGTSGAPSELHYLDAEEAEAHVRRLMEEKAEAFKNIYFAKNKDNPEVALLATEKDRDTFWSKQRPYLRFGKHDPDNVETGEGLAAFEKLMTWEQMWIKKEDALVAEGKDPKAAWPKWEAELFQKDYFKAASAVGSAFLEELEAKVGEMTQPRGITIGVVGKDSADPRDEATKAAGAMKGEDWSTFINIFAAERMPTRLIEVIETGYVSTMRDVFSDVRGHGKELADLQKVFNEAKDKKTENDEILEKNSQDKIDVKIVEMNNILPEGDNTELTEDQEKRKDELRKEVTRMQDNLRDAMANEADRNGDYTAAEKNLNDKQGEIDTSTTTAANSYKNFFNEDTRFSTVGSTRRTVK